MSGILNSQFGEIMIDDEVIARISGLAAMECYGVVGMASINMKDGLVQLLLGENLTKGIKVSVDTNKVSLDFHIIVEYGTKISAIAENLISTVKYKIEDMIGLEVGKINIYVEGVRIDNN